MVYLHDRGRIVAQQRSTVAFVDEVANQIEVIHRRALWRSMEAVEFAILEWLDWFNNRRLLSSIGNVPPAEAEATYWACQEDQAIEHDSSETASGVSWAAQW